MVVPPKEDDVSADGGLVDGGEPCGGAIVVATAMVQGHVAHDDDGAHIVIGKAVDPAGEHGRTAVGGRGVGHLVVVDAPQPGLSA